MIKATRITLAGNIPFENVEILTEEEQTNKGIHNYFEDSQIVLRCKDGIFVIPMYKIACILIDRNVTKLGTSISRKVKRLALAGNLTYSPAYIVHPNMHRELGIPDIFKRYEQFTFACNEGLIVTSDFNVTLMQL